jgi:hypothetical protein
VNTPVYDKEITALLFSAVSCQARGASDPGVPLGPADGRAAGQVDCQSGLGARSAKLMMGWTPPTASICQSGGVEHHVREASVSEVIIIGLDIVKHGRPAGSSDIQ